MNDNTDTGIHADNANDRLIDEISGFAGKTALPGEIGFVLKNARERVNAILTREAGIDERDVDAVGLNTVADNAEAYARTAAALLARAGGDDISEAAGALLESLQVIERTLTEAMRQQPAATPGLLGDIIEEAFTRARNAVRTIDASLIRAAVELDRNRTRNAPADQTNPGANTIGENAVEGDAVEGDVVEGDVGGEAPGASTGSDTPVKTGWIYRLPEPPKDPIRGCAKQGGRKAQERRERRRDAADPRGAQHRDRGNSPQQRRPSARKLNQYVLNEITGAISSVRPGETIPAGRRVIEQPANNPRPDVTAFFDARLLPAGSTLIPRWGEKAPELDAQLVGRLGRLARLAGYGEAARKTMFDQIARSGNPTKTMTHLITSLGGNESLHLPASEITPTRTRDDIPALISEAVNTGNADPIEFSAELPSALETSNRALTALREEHLPGVIESIAGDGHGTRIIVRGWRPEDKQTICDALRAAGGRDIGVKNTQVERDGRKIRAYLVTAHLRAAPIEVAAARTGDQPRVRYVVNDNGTVSAHYSVDLYGTTVTTPDIACEPSPASVEHLITHLASTDETTRRLLERIETGTAGGARLIAERVGPVTDLANARRRLDELQLTADAVLGDGYEERLDNAGDRLQIAGRTVKVTYHQGTAHLDEVALHPTDLRIAALPASVDMLEEDMPTTVQQIRFEERNGRQRIVEETVDVSELHERRQRFFERRDPRDAILAECRENFLAETTRTMADALLNPPPTREAVRNPEGRAKSIALSRSVDPYRAGNGNLVQLVRVLAAGQGQSQWTDWCDNQVRAYRDGVRRLRTQNRDIPTDFFDVINMGPQARGILLEAAKALLSERLGREATDDDVAGLAGQIAESIEENTFKAIDRGRLLARHRGWRRDR